MRSRLRRSVLSLVAAALLVLSACAGGGGSGAADEPAGPPQRGGELTVLLPAGFTGSWPSGLDPATNATGGANVSLMNAIYGGLFQLTANDDGSNARVTGVLAEGYEISEDGLTVTLRLREGGEFSDGTPFNAEAVAFNMERNLTAPCTCAPTTLPWAEDPITVAGELTVQMHFTQPNGAVMNGFPATNLNWIASPTALEQMGEEQFRLTPVGAGPFKVVSNQLSTELVLERNPNYFEEGKPYLDRLTFRSIGSEQAAYQALLSGQADAFEGLESTAILQQAQANDRLQVTMHPPTSPYVVQLNTSRPPFNDWRAREAMYYATNVQAIREGLFDNMYPVSQMFTGPGGLFHHAEVPGYRTYDLERARQLVREVGGIDITLITISQFVAEQVMTALQSQWQEAGMTVRIESLQLPALADEFRAGQWQAALQTAGAYDPAAGVGVDFRFRSDQQYTGVHDPQLDRMLDRAEDTIDPRERDRLYFEIGQYISDNAYAPFLFAFAPANLAVRGVHGPGLTTKIPLISVPAVLWQDVWRSST